LLKCTFIAGNTYNINPGPSLTHVFSRTRPNDDCRNYNTSNASDEDTHDALTDCSTTSLPSSFIKAPYPRKELRVRQNAQDDCMSSERQVVKLHRGSKAMVAQRILLSYDWRVQKCHIRCEVCEETEYVDEGKVDSGS
jgi:hypothetical protein